MKTIAVLLLIVFTSSILVYAYDLKGAIYDIGDGTYNVKAQGTDGRDFSGIAEEDDEGNLVVDLEDERGDSYSGVATENKKGGYDLNLTNEDEEPLKGSVD